ncbi:MAG: hypothetical protein GQ582_13730 [Methyloprofundus sp.]|nr:hypothetical protein [Methyloprofundus sp.]
MNTEDLDSRANKVAFSLQRSEIKTALAVIKADQLIGKISRAVAQGLQDAQHKNAVDSDLDNYKKAIHKDVQALGMRGLLRHTAGEVISNISIRE